MLPKDNRLKARNEFRQIYKKGKVIPMPCFVLYYRKRGKHVALNGFKVGFSVSKKIGNAVQRNRVKRCFRAATRQELASFKPGYDYILIARTGAKAKAVSELAQEIGKVLGKVPARGGL